MIRTCLLMSEFIKRARRDISVVTRLVDVAKTLNDASCLVGDNANTIRGIVNMIMGNMPRIATLLFV